jgi:hypothetical protein
VSRSAERSALNEAAFRAANEKIEQRRNELEVEEERTPYLCECDEPSCTEVILLTRDEYRRARSSDRSFVVRPGHTDDHGRVLMETDAYAIVEKTGTAGDVAESVAP